MPQQNEPIGEGLEQTERVEELLIRQGRDTRTAEPQTINSVPGLSIRNLLWRWGWGMSFAATTMVGIVACSEASPDASVRSEITATAEAPSQNPTPTVTRTPTPTVEPTHKPTPTPTAAEITHIPTNNEQPEAIKQYEAMSLDEFMTLPISQRLTYASWVERDIHTTANLWYDNTKNIRDLYPQTISLDNTPDEISTITGYRHRLAITLAKPDGSIDLDRALKYNATSELLPKDSTVYAYYYKFINDGYKNGHGLAQRVDLLSEANSMPATPSTIIDPLRIHTGTPYGDLNGIMIAQANKDGKYGEPGSAAFVAYWVPFTKYDGTVSATWVSQEAQ